MANAPSTPAPGLAPDVSSDFNTARRQAEDLVAARDYRGARQALSRLRQTLLSDPQHEMELLVVDRRLKELDQLEGLEDTREAEYLERGQFYINHYEYPTALRVWTSDRELVHRPLVKDRIAFTQMLLGRLESGAARAKVLLDAGKPEECLAEVAKLRNVDPKRSRLYNLERNAQNLLSQKQVAGLKEQVAATLAAGSTEEALALLEQIADLSHHIETVRWLKKMREQLGAWVVRELEKAAGRGDKARTDRLFRWLLRLNADGSFESEVERFRWTVGAGAPPSPAASPAPSGSAPPAAEPAPHAASPPAARGAEPWPAAGPSPRSPELRPAGAHARRSARPDRERPAVRAPASRRKVLAVAGLILGLLVVGHEAQNQFHFHSALHYREVGRLPQARRSLDLAPFIAIGRASAHTLRQEIEVLSFLEDLERALLSWDWPKAAGALESALKRGRGLPWLGRETEARLRLWRSIITALSTSGEPRESWSGFEELQKLEEAAAAVCPSLPPVMAESALRVGKNLLARNAFAEAAGVARRAQMSPAFKADAEALLGEVRSLALRAVEEAVAAGQFTRVESLQRVLEQKFPESPLDRKDSVRALELARAIRDATRALDAGDLAEAQRALHRAEEAGLRGPESRVSIQALRDRLAKAVATGAPAPAEAVPADQAEVAEALRIGMQGYQVPLPRNLSRPLTHTIFGHEVHGSWSLERDPADPLGYIVQGRVALPGGSLVQPVGDLRIGILLMSPEAAPLAASLVRVPLLLPGGSHDFEVRLAAEGAAQVRVGLEAP